MTKKNIQLVAIDLDGTLLTSQHDISPRTEAAVRQVSAQGIPVVVATGKTRASAETLLERLGLQTPGVYVQGLVVTNPDGSVRFEHTLPPDVTAEVIRLAESENITLLAYRGNQIMIADHTPYTSILEKFHEPPAVVVGPFSTALNDTSPNKLIFVDEPETISALRPRLESMFNGRANVITAAVSKMVEVLPPQANKGAGLKRLLDDLGIDPAHILAIGDAENDIEMLQMAGTGVAMGNAAPELKAIADVVVSSNDEDGVAEALEKFVLNASG
jgi:Cof subfamily protein (haloacid dehalogenase superfamily)